MESIMEVKLFEVRDKGTFVVCLGVELKKSKELTPKEDYLIGRAGYSEHPLILFGSIVGGMVNEFNYDPYDWKQRTYKYAHHYVQDNWDDLKSGDLVDVEFILGETKAPKKSEWEDFPF